VPDEGVTTKRKSVLFREGSNDIGLFERENALLFLDGIPVCCTCSQHFDGNKERRLMAYHFISFSAVTELNSEKASDLNVASFRVIMETAAPM
jgi:hypothetical protein